MKSRRVLAALFLSALAVRLVAVSVAMATGRFPEFWEYESLARNLINGKGFLYSHFDTDYRAYVEPLYPWLVAGVYRLTGHSTVALAAVQCLISAFVAVVVYDVGRRTFGHRSGVVAGALVALHPGLAGYASKFHPLVLDTLFISLVLLAVLRLVQEPAPGTAAVFGTALGGCVLTRPTILAFIPFALAWVTYRQRARRGAAYAALGLVIAVAIASPWVVRNYVVLGTFVLTRTNTGYVFWLGNHPGATGGATDTSGTASLFDGAPLELRQRILSSDEIAQNRIFLSEALRHVRGNPAAFVGRAMTKLYYFWWAAPYSGRRYPQWQFALYRGFYSMTLVLAILGLVFAWRHRSPGQLDGLVLGLVLLAAISVVQSLFYVDARHRLAVEPLLMVFSGHGLACLMRLRWAPQSIRAGP
jgi:4-amino-4-deoxy-L-arabinose transferase-like glycosyltransferase